MNILLCVTGFIFCFSSWSMDDVNKQKAYDTIVSMVRIIISQPKFSVGIFYNWRNESKKDFYIEENDQRIVGGTLEDNAIFRIKSLIDGQKIKKAYLELGRQVSDKTFNVDTIFEHGNKRYTLTSYFLSFLKDQNQYITEDDEMCAVDLLGLLLNKHQYRWTVGAQDRKDCYIRKNDLRMNEKCNNIFDC